MSNNNDKIIKRSEQRRYGIITLYAIYILLCSFLFDSLLDILMGMKTIIISPDLLLTDYFELANIGAAFFNSGLLMLMCILIAYRSKAIMSGTLIAAIFTVGGFALFGKNVFNVVSIIFGVYLHSKLKKEQFTKFLIIALFGTALSPLVSQVAFGLGLSMSISIPISLAMGTLIGLLLPPLASSFISFHQGFNLYNIGFTAGIVGMFFMSLFRALGLNHDLGFIVYSGSSFKLSIVLGVFFFSMIIVSLIFSNRKLKEYKKLLKRPGRLVTDFVYLHGFGLTLINIGILGLMGLVFVISVGGALSGPVIGGIFTLAGFGGFGKHPKNITPVALGVLLAAFITGVPINSQAVLITALFATTLAPISGHYGAHVGIIAGFLHFALVSGTSALHGGMNLYNNGFSGGFVAATMVPIMESIRKETINEG